MKSRYRPRLSLRLLLLLVAGIAMVLGGLSYRIKHQQASVHLLRELGGQLDTPTLTIATWINGLTVESVQFLGPAAGDEVIANVGDAANNLGVERITFLETRVTADGQRRLQARLPQTKIRMVTGSPGIPRPMDIEVQRR